MLSKIYIPVSSLKEEDIRSLVELALNKDEHRVDTHGGRQVAIKYLLTLRSINFNLDNFVSKQQLKTFEDKLKQLTRIDLYKKEFCENNDITREDYWELKSQSNKIHEIAKANRSSLTQDQFTLKQLKVYFNRKQIENIPYSKATFDDSGFVDEDSRNNLANYRLDQRKNQGSIHTKQGRIENVIFDVPESKQIIVLDFADERMPGGLYLDGASTQEETICYNSNTYQALLDFKYKKFDGGFFIPEFGCLYIKDAIFVNPNNKEQKRHADVIAAACYDLTGVHGLYKPPNDPQQIEFNTKKKLESVIAAAQANSHENGANTYLLLGPIGCGAFKNKLESIAKLWAEILLEPLNQQLQTQQRHAFHDIWFLSGTQQKLQVFENAFGSNIQRHS